MTESAATGGGEPGPEPPARPRAIVLIHGVGSPRPGEFLDAWIAGFQRRDPSSWARDAIVLDDTRYEAGHCNSPAARHTMFEVNWADLQRPLRGIVGVVRHVIQLLIATVRIATENRELRASRRPLAQMYAWALFGLAWWSYVPTIVFMLARCATSTSASVAIVVGASLALAVMAWWLARFAPQFLLGYAWAAGMLALHIGLSLGLVTPAGAVSLTAWAYAASQVLLAVLLAAATVELFRDPELTGDQHFAHLALLWMPLAIMSGVASIIWFASLGALYVVPVLAPEFYGEWRAGFITGLPFDLRLVEYVTTVAVALIGVAALVVVLAYFRPPRGVRAGLHAQNAFAVWLRTSPALLAIAGIVFLVSLLRPATQTLATSTSMLDIYRISALRLLPFLLFLLPQLRPVVDVIGDVAFYLTPGRLSIRDEAVRRVRRLVKDVAERDLGDLVLVGFSQGSVLGRVGLAESGSRPATLATVGCPIGSLYARFLHWTPAPPLGEGVRWWNGFHDGDFIAGPVPGVDEDDPLGPGAHDRYELDEPVIDIVLGAAAGGQAGGP